MSWKPQAQRDRLQLVQERHEIIATGFVSVLFTAAFFAAIILVFCL